jgi:hypothetical protein
MKNATVIFIVLAALFLLGICYAIFTLAHPGTELPAPNAASSQTPAPAQTTSPDVGHPASPPPPPTPNGQPAPGP